MSTIIRCYSELIKLPTFEERFEYLRLNGRVGADTFGHDRFINQYLYQQSRRWKQVRDKVIFRDMGCDLGIEDRPIYARPIVHHMNVVTLDDILKEREWIFDPEYLITTMHNTHNAIHYGNINLLVTEPVERTPYDTCPWRRT